MAKKKGSDPAFLFYPGDYLRDTQCMSANAQVAYDRIICEHMRNICISYAQLKFFTKRLSDDEKEELEHVLTEVDGGFEIEWVARSIDKRREYSASRSKNREGKVSNSSNNISESYVPHMENEIEIENRDEEKGMKVQGERGLTLTKKEVAPRTPDTIRAYFAEHGQPQEADKFIDYYQSNGWKVGRNAMKDWQATARNWMRRAQPDQKDRRIVRNTTVADIQDTAKRLAKLMGETNEHDNDSSS